MLSVEKFYEVLNQLQSSSAALPVNKALCEVMRDETTSTAATSLLQLMDEAIFEVENCNLGKVKKQVRFRETLTSFRGAMIESFLRREFTKVGTIFDQSEIEKIGAIADTVSELILGDVEPLDRDEFSKKTLEMIAEVKAWGLEGYANRSLVLGLGLIAEISSSAATSVSDGEIRRRVTRLVAAFAVEFAHLDKDFESRWDKIRRWAKLGYQGSALPLALTADVATIAGLLPKP